ncbi:hypothetical protein K8Z61_14415 [Nocardioides sp. TRM66260-LWL]|uniref:M14 family zinc carboxypeptidase n=1 Tax=Nocardioides sp. TRM66260-LWL TaxID=2874478 RepID=UPI001CC73986|nr:M14 family zinc carboxypeptidase [Nocardioides sp. TRM66260-LWL]MBZ5735685.1 hypothetical protein [Nocardioides sp. TRM66260-LWL]
MPLRPVLARPRRRSGVVGLTLALGLSGLALTGALTTPATGDDGATAVSETPFTPSLVTITTPDRGSRLILQRLGLDLTEHAGHDYVEAVLHTPADRAALDAAGFDYQVRIPDLVAREVERQRADAAYAAARVSSPLPSGRTAYRTLADYEADMAALAKRRPSLAKRFALPHKTLDGRTVYGIEIGRDVQRAADGRPTFLLLGVHHAREWPSGELAMEFATDLVKNYGTDARIRGLLDRARVVVVPVVNADGFDLSRTDGDVVDLRTLNDADPLGGTGTTLATPGQAYKRKNCRIVDDVDTPDGTCRASLLSPGGFGLGVDLNRNYGGFWGGPGAAATMPGLGSDGGAEAGLADPTYRGAAPFSEPETQNVQQLVRSRQVTMLISNHTFSNLVLRPNGVAPTTIGPDGIPVGDAPDELGLKRLGRDMAAQNGYQNIHGWQLYDTTGTTEDWSYNATGGFGYTFEIGENEFHPPFSEVVGEYLGTGKLAGKGNREAYLIALEHALDTRYHGVLTGEAPVGATLRLRKTFSSPTWSSSFEDFVDSTLKVGRTGRFSWIVNPSTRPVVRSRTYEKPAATPFATKTVEGGSLTPLTGTADYEFVATQPSDLLQVTLDWPTPDDLDLEVFRKNADGSLTSVASSGNLPGEKEIVRISDVTPGTYVARVRNAGSVAPSHTVVFGQYDATTVRTPGKREAYTLTCELRGSVRSSQRIFINRNQTRELDLSRACRQ